MAVLPDLTQPAQVPVASTPAPVPGNVTPDPLSQAPDGNITPDQIGTPSENNDGQPPDFTGFWDGPDDAPSGDPSGSPSATPGESPVQPAATLQAQPMQQLQGILDGLPFENIMTPEIMEAVGKGDLDTFNTAMKSQMRSGVKETLFLAAKMMAEMQSDLIKKMDSRFADLNAADKSETALFDALPFTKNPAIRPIAKGIFAQALVNTKGDQALALTMTQQFLRETMKLSADDLDFSVAPKGEHVDSELQPSDKIDWAAELLARD